MRYQKIADKLVELGISAAVLAWFIKFVLEKLSFYDMAEVFRYCIAGAICFAYVAGLWRVFLSRRVSDIFYSVISLALSTALVSYLLKKLGFYIVGFQLRYLIAGYLLLVFFFFVWRGLREAFQQK